MYRHIFWRKKIWNNISWRVFKWNHLTQPNLNLNYDLLSISRLAKNKVKNQMPIRALMWQFVHKCFVHPIFLSFGFWYFGHFSCMIFFPVFFRLAHLALQNVNKDYVIFSYFRNFIAKSDQKPKTKNGMNETKNEFIFSFEK